MAVFSGFERNFSQFDVAFQSLDEDTRKQIKGSKFIPDFESGFSGGGDFSIGFGEFPTEGSEVVFLWMRIETFSFVELEKERDESRC